MIDEDGLAAFIAERDRHRRLDQALTDWEALIAPYLEWYHPLKGAIYARDWIAEARETRDVDWYWECVAEAGRAIQFLRRAQ